jgi:hypothetical protein
MLLEHVDVGEVDEAGGVAVDGAREADLGAVVIEADDVAARLDEVVLALPGAPERPVRGRQVGVQGGAVESVAVVR